MPRAADRAAARIVIASLHQRRFLGNDDEPNGNVGVANRVGEIARDRVHREPHGAATECQGQLLAGRGRDAADLAGGVRDGAVNTKRRPHLRASGDRGRDHDGAVRNRDDIWARRSGCQNLGALVRAARRQSRAGRERLRIGRLELRKVALESNHGRRRRPGGYRGRSQRERGAPDRQEPGLVVEHQVVGARGHAVWQPYLSARRALNRPLRLGLIDQCERVGDLAVAVHQTGHVAAVLYEHPLERQEGAAADDDARAVRRRLRRWLDQNDLGAFRQSEHAGRGERAGRAEHEQQCGSGVNQVQSAEQPPALVEDRHGFRPPSGSSATIVPRRR